MSCGVVAIGPSHRARVKEESSYGKSRHSKIAEVHLPSVIDHVQFHRNEGQRTFYVTQSLTNSGTMCSQCAANSVKTAILYKQAQVLMSKAVESILENAISA